MMEKSEAISRKSKLTGMVYAMYFFFPITYLLIRYGEMSFTYTELLGMAGALAWGLVLTGKFFMRKPDKSDLVFPAAIWFGLFILAALLSFINSYSLVVSLKFFLRKIVFLYLIFIVFPYNNVKTKKQFYKLTEITAISGTIVAFISLFFLSREIGGVILRVNPRAFLGVPLLGFNHNPVAEMMLVALPCGLIAWARSKAKNKKFWLMALALMGFILLATFSKTGWLAVVTGAAAFLIAPRYFHQVFNWEKLKARLPAILLGGLLMIPFGYLMLRLATSPVADSSYYQRLFFVRKSFELYQSHPIIGNGLDTYPAELLHDPLFLIDFSREGMTNPHGVIWKLMAEMGTLGVFAYCMILVYLMRRLWLASKLTHNQKEQFALTVLWAMVAALAMFQLFQTGYLAQRFWLALGLAFMALKLMTPRESPERLRKKES